jgi:hypothetical protein
MSKGSIKPLIGGAVGGAIVMTIVLFASGWAISSGASEANAENFAREAVVSELAKICVAQSKKDPTLAASAKTLNGMSSWTRGDYVKEKGWAVMPGIDTPDEDVMTECGKIVGGAT